MYDMKLDSPLSKLREPAGRVRGEPVDSSSASLVKHLLGHQPSPPPDTLDEFSEVAAMGACAAAVIASIVCGVSTHNWSTKLESFFTEAMRQGYARTKVLMLGAGSALLRGDEEAARSRLAQLPPVGGAQDEFEGLLDIWSRHKIDWSDDSEKVHLLFTALRIARGLNDGGLAVLLMAAGALGEQDLGQRLRDAACVLEDKWPRPALSTRGWSEWDLHDQTISYPVEVRGEGALGLWDPLLREILAAFPFTIAGPVVGNALGSPRFEKLTKRRLKRMYADPAVAIEFQHRLGDGVDLTAGFAAADRLFRTAVTYGVPRFEVINEDQGLRLRGPVRWVVTQGDQTLHEIEVVVNGSREEDRPRSAG